MQPQTLQRFLDVSQSTDIETFRGRLIAFASELDFGLVSAMVLDEAPGMPPKVHWVGNTPEAFIAATTSSEDAARDPVLNSLKRMSTPLVWDQSLYAANGTGDLWEQQAPFGYKTGVAVALHLPHHRHFYLGVDREEALPTDGMALATLLGSLQLLAVHAQDIATTLLCSPAESAGAKPNLTPRELDCLGLTMNGMTASQIGNKLYLSEHTVHFHIRNSLTKLGVVNKHQAVLKAIRLGLIRP